MAERFQRGQYIFLEIDQPETRIAYGGHICKRIRTKRAFLLKDLSEVSYQVAFHLAEQFHRKRFLEIDQPETRIAYGGHVF